MKNRVNFILSFATFSISFYVILSEIRELNFLYLIHICIIAISSISLFSYSNKPYSLYKIYHLFNLFFFGIAPVLQDVQHIRFVGEPVIPYKIKLLTSTVILIATILYNVIYYIVSKRFSIKGIKKYYDKYNTSRFLEKNFNIVTKVSILVMSVTCFFVIYKINNSSILSMLLRGGIFENKVELNKPVSLLLDKFFRPMSLILFIISYKYNRKSYIINITLFLLFFITAFPLGMPRNATAGFYLPLILLFIPVFSKKNVFTASLISGLLIVFPFLDNFRYFKDFSDLRFGLNFNMFTQLHFDAYASLARIINANIITYGQQLLGVLFFFIPRSVWHSKPFSSGIYHADLLGMTFDNISCTYLAEGYINFGYIGIFLFLFLLAYINAILDKSFWMLKSNNSFLNIIYVILIGMFLFVLRGDLMNGFAYTFGLIFTSIFTYKLINFFLRLKYGREKK